MQRYDTTQQNIMQCNAIQYNTISFVNFPCICCGRIFFCSSVGVWSLFMTCLILCRYLSQRYHCQQHHQQHRHHELSYHVSWLLSLNHLNSCPNKNIVVVVIIPFHCCYYCLFLLFCSGNILRTFYLNNIRYLHSTHPSIASIHIHPSIHYIHSCTYPSIYSCLLYSRNFSVIL